MCSSLNEHERCQLEWFQDYCDDGRQLAGTVDASAVVSTAKFEHAYLPTRTFECGSELALIRVK